MPCSSGRFVTPFRNGARSTLIAVMLVCGSSLSAAGAQRDSARTTANRDTVFEADALLVTATRSPRPVFLAPVPAAVVTADALQRSHFNTVTDALRRMPGVDVNGVGVQQVRPMIRGQRGQRILLLQDGMRMNNSRRQQDFGEVPALVDIQSVERIEVVRGPASVLYGSDAIGGVINVVTRKPSREGVHGMVSYRFGEEEDQHRGAASVLGRVGRVDFDVVASLRRAEDYHAPAGRFGEIILDDDVVVHGTGVEDRSLAARIAVAVGDGHTISVRAERYAADDAGFGFVDPAAYAPAQPRIDIGYPDQRFWKTTAAWSATGLRTVFVDRVEATAWLQDNERSLTFDLFQSFGPQAPPGAGVAVETRNFTDLRTWGTRIEARKLVSSTLALTYGVDAFRDGSENTDSSLTTVTGFGPPQQMVSTRVLVPDAKYRSAGAFVQGELSVGSHTTIIAGARAQTVRATAEPGGAIDIDSKSADAMVGAINVLHRLGQRITLAGSVGRAFRAPNLIEWFFEGPTPEGNGYQVRSPDLIPEKALSVDAGVRYRDRRLALEAFVFRNRVEDGIRIRPTGEEVDGLTAFQNVNVAELIFRGLELSGELHVADGLTVDGGYTRLDSEDGLDPGNPIGDTYSSRVTGAIRYAAEGDAWWLEYAVRHNGDRKDVFLGENPVGDVLPSFTTQAVRGGFTLDRRAPVVPRLTIGIDNLTNELYAEASNVSFFRPEPRRRITLGLEASF
ncbi:MAG: TonB-dependent receptor [Gemmatimonadetes bacterium]|nr:TonB-dependent receptor [Gemmatimonadota bacterium]